MADSVCTVGTPVYEDMQCDFLSGKRLDLEALIYLPEMSQNEEVMEPVKARVPFIWK